jgi:hypothetical protein
MNIKCRHCDALHWMAEQIVKSSEDSSEFGMCCNHGKVEIQCLCARPDALKRLFLDDSAQAKEFQNDMW